MSSRETIKQTSMRISIHARFFPAQLAWPMENGRKAVVLWTYLLWALKTLGSKTIRWSSGSQRSGRNESGEGEKQRGSRCIEYVGIKTLVPSGTKLASETLSYDR